MGFLWLGVAPLVAGWIGETFGLRWQPMLSGVAFVGHQLGSFAGALGGGLIFDLAESYTLAWQVGVALGLSAGLVQAGFAVAIHPSRSSVDGSQKVAGGNTCASCDSVSPKRLRKRGALAHILYRRNVQAPLAEGPGRS